MNKNLQIVELTIEKLQELAEKGESFLVYGLIKGEKELNNDKYFIDADIALLTHYKKILKHLQGNLYFLPNHISSFNRMLKETRIMFPYGIYLVIKIKEIKKTKEIYKAIKEQRLERE